MISSASKDDWEKFWTGEDIIGMYSEYVDDPLEKIWWEMESIEPLTPDTSPYNKIPKRY
tara:strand:+ start:684 stop:860 length:177 start_codon:yes stop_codon:yes gene_type:complete